MQNTQRTKIVKLLLILRRSYAFVSSSSQCKIYKLLKLINPYNEDVTCSNLKKMSSNKIMLHSAQNLCILLLR